MPTICPILSLLTTYPLLSCHITTHILSCLILPYHVLPLPEHQDCRSEKHRTLHHILTTHNLSYHILSCLITAHFLTCPINTRILPCLIMFCHYQITKIIAVKSIGHCITSSLGVLTLSYLPGINNLCYNLIIVVGQYYQSRTPPLPLSF